MSAPRTIVTRGRFRHRDERGCSHSEVADATIIRWSSASGARFAPSGSGVGCARRTWLLRPACRGRPSRASSVVTSPGSCSGRASGWRPRWTSGSTSCARWRGGELDRLLNARHSAMHELVAGRFAQLPGWQIVPEASFSIYGERGAVDVLGWHAARGMLLVVELKTEIVDVQDLLASVDRKRRLADQDRSRARLAMPARHDERVGRGCRRPHEPRQAGAACRRPAHRLPDRRADHGRLAGRSPRADLRIVLHADLAPAEHETGSRAGTRRARARAGPRAVRFVRGSDPACPCRTGLEAFRWLRGMRRVLALHERQDARRRMVHRVLALHERQDAAARRARRSGAAQTAGCERLGGAPGSSTASRATS